MFVPICENPAVLKLLALIFKILRILVFVIPIILILKTSFDLFGGVTKAEINSKEDKEKIIRRIINSVIVLLVPFFVKLLISLLVKLGVNSFTSYFQCLTNINNIDYYQNQYDGLLAKVESDKAKDKEDSKIKGT